MTNVYKEEISLSELINISKNGGIGAIVNVDFENNYSIIKEIHSDGERFKVKTVKSLFDDGRDVLLDEVIVDSINELVDILGSDFFYSESSASIEYDVLSIAFFIHLAKRLSELNKGCFSRDEIRNASIDYYSAYVNDDTYIIKSLINEIKDFDELNNYKLSLSAYLYR